MQIPYAFAKQNGIIVGTGDDGTSVAFLREGCNIEILAEVSRKLGVCPKPTDLTTAEFDGLVAETYGTSERSAAEVVDDIGQDLDLSRLFQELPPIEDLLDSDDDAPIIRMINAVLTQAVREQASDIHIEPYERHSVVRFRHDGMLRNVIEPNRALHAALVSRIKIMAQLDIAEKRLPQDGRIAIRVAGHFVDVRVSTIPTNHGERVVMRLLDKSPEKLDLKVLGMAADTLTRVDALIHQPHGIVLVTGPTGSGKTTTLYAALRRLDASSLNILTVEDPVEYELSGIGQIQVNPRIELGFAKALRSILRQDPDVVMIGEIRDLETAQIAVQASLTGHLVLATLHTNDAASAVTRLIDLGVEPFLLASSLLGVMAQRLVRRLCPECRVPYATDAGEAALIGGKAGDTLYRARGCPSCGNTGYHGRSGIYELLVADDALRRLIHDRAQDSRLRDHGLSNGMRLLRDDGMRWVRGGETTLDELLRVTRN